MALHAWRLFNIHRWRKIRLMALTFKPAQTSTAMCVVPVLAGGTLWSPEIEVLSNGCVRL